MTAPDEAMDYLDVRNRWPNEATDFTPWVAENLDMLSDALRVKLELVRMEAPVGPFFCDILAREVGSGEKVAIENQLEWSDHSHLTQLLTYAAGLDARIAVWVAPEFRYEHARDPALAQQLDTRRAQVLRHQGNAPEERCRTAGALSPPSGDPRRLEQGHHSAARGYHVAARPAVP